MSPRRVAKAMGLFGAAALAVVLRSPFMSCAIAPPPRPCSRWPGLMPSALLHAHNLKWTQMSGGRANGI